ncbi:MAG: thioredoxin [Muribaculaceae bacterium]|nr:thioredoxin [Muribaculaceae bacterium]
MAFTFTDENVEEIIESGKPVIIDFWATWCGPCMNMAPTIDELAEQYKEEVVIGKYNVDEESDFSSQHRIMSLPTILFFKNGKKTDIRLAGSQSKATLEAKIKELLAL